MKKITLSVGLAVATAMKMAAAAEGPVPTGIPHLDHVFIIMMENHGFGQVIGNPNMPFFNQYATTANLAKNYFAVAHPSLTNYLEVAGGSNFGVLNDNSPDWHNANCTPNLVSGVPSNESVGTPICAISGVGKEAATPAIDFYNEVTGDPANPASGDWNIDGITSIPAATNIVAKTIADQLASAGRSWKSYQESLPASGADKINASDGQWSNLSDFSAVAPLSAGDVVALYAVKHNPFVYFASTQAGTNRRNSLHNVAGFYGDNGLYADLAKDDSLPNYVFIAPNQCNDQHGKGGAGPFCAFDPNDQGTLVGLNPALMAQGDKELQSLVDAIHHSSAWRYGKSAIVVLWDENDYSVGIPNQVATLVETNYGSSGVQSINRYTHYSLLKSVEAAFGLPCLNHACDANVAVMSDVFGDNNRGHNRH
jgi:phosphatidylinositol-3-phosphatase